MSQINFLNDIQANTLNPEFSNYYQNVINNYFSRDPKLWPIFNDPTVQKIIQFRKNNQLQQNPPVSTYPNGEAILKQLQQGTLINQKSSLPNDQSTELLSLIASLSKNWENPRATENVIAMPCDPAIHGAILGTIGNPNMVYCEYSGLADELEKVVIKQVANLIGYDPEQASGLFTQGGTMCNLYGYLFGLRKSIPDAKHYGMGADQNYRIINSQGGHYSNMTNLSLLGVDIQNKTIRIKLTASNDIDLEDLEIQMRSCYTVHCKIPAIMLTTGTTDTFGVDQVKEVYELRNKLCAEYNIAVKPHIHVDAAIGWSMLFFLNYDFLHNPLAINDATLFGIQRNVERFSQLKYADSITIDFHKWGHVPYTSSLVMVKNKNDFKVLENDPENFTYFEHDLEGQTHLQSTIECTRSGVGIFSAYSALQYIGMEGYQVIIAHALQNANYLRHKLIERGDTKIIAPENQGPSVGFRLYNSAVVKDVDAEFELDLQCARSQEAFDRMTNNTKWHRDIFLNRGKQGLYTNWVESIACSTYIEHSKYIYLPGEKAVFMNPNTLRSHIDDFLNILPKKA